MTRLATVPNHRLLSAIVGPEGVSRGAAVHDSDEANEIIEAPVRDALNVEVKCGRVIVNRRAVQDINLLVSEGNGLEGLVVLAGLSGLSLSTPARPVGVCKLGDGRYAAAPLLLDFLFRHSPQEAQIVCLFRQPMAVSPELALVAVPVQDHTREPLCLQFWAA